MDALPIQSFPANVPFKQPVVITHYVSMVIAFLGCYPLLLTQQLARKKNYILGASIVFATIGFISGYFVQYQDMSTTALVSQSIAILLIILLAAQCALCVYRSSTFSEHFPLIHTVLSKVLHTVPKWVDLALGWVILLIALSYLMLAGVVFTDSCIANNLQSQCLMPVAMGTGFLLYGTFVLLHLLAIIKLPRPSTPEYYEGIILTCWGLISLFMPGTPILGSEWRAINLGLLWFTGGLFSISLSVQTWIPALRERNIINSFIVCLTGRAIVRGITQAEDTYAAEIHTMLGYILMIGAITRITQIIFRKSPVDNLPHRMFQQNADTTDILVDDDEEEGGREEEINTTKDTAPKCKHRMIFATITLLSGLFTSFLAVGGGILFSGASIGWLRYMRYYIEDPSTYVNMTLAVAFLWCAYIFGLCTIYKNLKTRNAIHQYEYLELENQVSTTSIVNNHSSHDTSENSNTDSHLLLQQEYIASPISSPTTVNMEAIIPKMETTQTSEKTIRPSEYRAKRRSLLIQPNVKLNNVKRSSTHGVGGILPDEIVQYDPRKSWLSSGSSSVGYYSGSNLDSSAPNSPPYFNTHSNNRRFSETQQFNSFEDDDHQQLLK